MYHPTFADISHDESTAVRCINLVERCAAKFMRTGGGYLSGEYAARYRKIKEWQRRGIRRRLLETNGNHQAEIGREFGCVSQASVHKIWKEMSA